MQTRPVFFFLVLYEHDVKLNDFFCTSYINTFLTWEFITPPIDLQAPIYDINQFIWFICKTTNFKYRVFSILDVNRPTGVNVCKS